MKTAGTTPVGVSNRILLPLLNIAKRSDLTRTKLISLILEQYISEPKYRRPFQIYAGIDIAEMNTPPMTEEEQEDVKAEQSLEYKNVEDELKQDGVIIVEWDDPFPDSPIKIDKDIRIRDYGIVKKYERDDLLTKGGLFTKKYKLAVGTYYGDNEIDLTMETIDDRLDHLNKHIIPLILRGLIPNTRPIEKNIWGKYLIKDEFTDEYIDAMLQYFRNEKIKSEASDLETVTDKKSHISHFLPILENKGLIN